MFLTRNYNLGVSDQKRKLGSYYTHGNPFLHEPFKLWFGQTKKNCQILEPFAGNGQIIKLMQEAGFRRSWKLFDIDEKLTNVEIRDSIIDFPIGFETVITNPPYLSYHFAKRKKLKTNKEYFLGFESLYQTAVHKALNNCNFVAMIIPESFLTSGLFKDRLQKIISLPYQMFIDTEMPTCLAMWGPQASDKIEIWRGDRFLGLYSELASTLIDSPCANRIKFNVLSGSVGLKAIDNSVGPSITFCPPNLIPAEKIKHSARLVSRIHISGLNNPNELINMSNKILNNWRVDTQDILLTAFKGVRSDGLFRRRLDFKNARYILANALCQMENHNHPKNEQLLLV